MLFNKRSLLRFDIFHEEIVNCKIKEIVSWMRSGGTPKSDNPDFYLGEIPFISIPDMKNKYLIKSKKQISQLGLNNSSSYLITKNSILLSVYATIGEICINKIDVALPQSILGIKPNDDINLEYLYYLLQKSRSIFIKLQQIGSQPNISLDIVKNIKLFVTYSSNEQTKIANFFILLDKQIQLIERKLELYELRKKYYLNNMFCDSDFPNIRFRKYNGEIKIHQIKNLYKMYSGLSGLDSKNFVSGEDQYITYSSIFAGNIIDERMLKSVNLMNKKQNIVIKNDILITATSETPREIGFNSIYLGEKPVYLNSFSFGIRALVQINNHYVNYLLKSNIYRVKIIGFGQGSTRYNFLKSGFKEMNVHIPEDIEEQTKISNLFSSLDESIQNVKKQKDQLTKRKTYYLNNMFV